MTKSLRDQALQIIVASLDKDARRILRECVDERTYQHQTFNLYDSYGYGIYLQGKLVKDGYLDATPKATESKKWYGKTLQGRDEITRFLKSEYHPVGIIDLAVAAAMPYAKVLEDGGGNLKKSYRVISMSFQKLHELAYDYEGKVRIINQ